MSIELVAFTSIIIEKSIIYYRSTIKRIKINVLQMGGVTCMSHLKVKRDGRYRSDLQKNPFDTCVVNADISIHFKIRPIFFTIDFYCLLAYFRQTYYHHHHFFCVHACMQTHTCENFFQTESCIVCRLKYVYILEVIIIIALLFEKSAQSLKRK